MRRLHTVLFLLAFAISLGSAAQTYRWVDEDGVVHYSDAPNPASENPEADRIDIPEPNVIQSTRPAPVPSSSTSAAPAEATPPGAEENEADFSYRSVRIIAPIEGSTLWNIGGTLTVSMQVSPALRPDHGYVLYLDGELFQRTPVQGSSITIDDVYRGEHTLRAAVHSSTGAELISSEPVTFYVRQTTIRR